MSLGLRLKEERLRLKLNQTDFAAIANASKAAQINWEKDVNSPPGSALSAYAEAGVDVLYVLTAKRAAERPETIAAKIAEEIREVERDLLDPQHQRLANQTEQEAEENAVDLAGNKLRAILKYDAQFMTPEMIEHASNLLDITSDPKKLALFRAADFAQKRRDRERKKESLSAYLDENPYEPSDTVRNVLVMIALDYGVPVKLLVELVYEIFTDITDRQAKGEPLGTD